MSSSTDVGTSLEKPVSVWYMIGLVAFTLGTGVINFCLLTALQGTLKPLTNSTFMVGLLTAMVSMNTMWVTPYASWKSDRIWTRFGRRKPLVMAMTPVLVVTLLTLPHCNSLWLMTVVVFVLTVALSALLGLIAAAIGDSIPDRQRPMATGMWHFTANGLATFMMSRFVLGLTDPGMHRIGFATVKGAAHWPYTVACCIFVAAAATFVLVFREHYVPPRAREKFGPFAYGREIVQVKEHLLIYIILFFQPMFVLVGSWYFYKLGTETLGLTAGQYGSAHAWGGITVMLACVPLGYIFTRVKLRKSFTMAACVMALVPITWGLFFMKTQAGIAFYFAAQQFAFAVFRLNFSPYITEYTTPRSVGTIFGVVNAVNGVVRIIMVLLAGVLIDLMGKNYRLPLWGGYVGVAVCVVCLAMMRPPEKVRHLIDAE
jgi:MFS family permease